MITDRLRKIEAIPSYVKIDKIKEYKEELESKRKENKLLDGVIKGHFNLVEEYKRLSEHHKGLNQYIPHINIQETQPTLIELEDLVGYIGSDNYANVICNTAGGGLAGAYMAGVSSIGFEMVQGQPTRRKALQAIFIMGLMGSFAGGIIGTTNSVLKYKKFKKTENNALFLQNIIDQVYRKHTKK